MSPEDLSAKHPRLYHVTDPTALPGILRHGLLPASDLLSLFEVPNTVRQSIEHKRRPASVTLTHPVHGEAIITDNRPLSEQALKACLDDGLTPEDWLAILNRRIFFWSDEHGLNRLLGARLNRVRERLVLVMSTLSLARRYQERMEVSAINSGSTIRRAARRGLSTFVPLQCQDVATGWSRPGQRHRIREVTITGGVADVADHLIEYYRVSGRTPERVTL